MRHFFCCALLLAVIAVNYAQSADVAQKDDGRIYFSTFTVILSTVTTTTTSVSTTSCTTSTAALKTCSVGRRRRGLFYDADENQGRARRGLFYNDDEDFTKEETISAPVKRSAESTEPAVTIGSNWVPLTVESGFSVPDGSPVAESARFKLAYGTSTITTTSISTTTVSLTATCASTTGFQTCSSSGK